MRQTGRIEGVRGLAGLTTEEAAGRRSALSGLTGLETSVAGGVRSAAQLSVDQQIATGTEILKRIQLGQQVSEADLALLSDLSKQPGVFDSIIGAVGAGAGVISAWKKH
jgi:phage-related protein